jgi:hypothetical protein
MVTVEGVEVGPLEGGCVVDVVVEAAASVGRFLAHKAIERRRRRADQLRRHRNGDLAGQKSTDRPQCILHLVVQEDVEYRRREKDDRGAGKAGVGVRERGRPRHARMRHVERGSATSGVEGGNVEGARRI